MVLVDATGKSLPACHVFKIFIEAFVNYTMQIINREKRLEKGHWMWTLVVNVTAYLRHTGEQFLRSCAEQVNIFSNSMVQMQCSGVQHMCSYICISKHNDILIECHKLLDKGIKYDNSTGWKCNFTHTPMIPPKRKS